VTANIDSLPRRISALEANSQTLIAVRHVSLLGWRQVAILLRCQTSSDLAASLPGMQKTFGRLRKPRQRDKGCDNRNNK
jgi:hypothetical protein